jgi:hypothetical protein
VRQPERDHGGEARGDGKVGPAATGDPAPTSGSVGVASSGDTTELAPRDESPDLDAGGSSGRSTKSINGASATAPSSPIGETQLVTTATGGGEAEANTAERYAAGKDPRPTGTHPRRTSRSAAPAPRCRTPPMLPASTRTSADRPAQRAERALPAGVTVAGPPTRGRQARCIAEELTCLREGVRNRDPEAGSTSSITRVSASVISIGSSSER